MATKLNTTTDMVKRFLTEQPETRGNDNLLILKVLEEYAACFGINLEEMSVVKFLHMYAGCEFPSFETIRRSRQKLQQQYPELRPDKTVQTFREEQEKQYRDYARGAV